MNDPSEFFMSETVPEPRKARRAISDPTLDAGLPANIDAEKTILGAILLDNAAFTEASENLEPEDFSLDSHRRIFQRMTGLMQAQRAVDIVTLASELSRFKEVESVGGTAYLASLTEGLPRRPVIKEYIRIVKDKSLLRKVMAISSKAISQAADQSDAAMDVIGAAAESLQVLSEQGVSSPLQTFGTFVEKSYRSIDEVFKHSARSLGLPSGLRELDELTCGFQRRELIVVGARPSMGKTALGLAFAGYASIRLDRTTVFFSLEMKKEALLHRLVSMYGTVNLQDIREGRWSATTQRYALEAMDQIVSAPLFVDDQKNMPIRVMQSKAARLKAQTGHLDLVVIDQLNYIPLPSDGKRYNNRSQDLGFVTRGLKGMADALDAPVVVLHQLNRANEKRDDREPRLSDLRESGDIEQDADLVLFPHRPSYYDKNASDKERIKAVIIVGKQRQGPTGRAACEYIAEQTLFRDEEVKPSLW